MTQRSNRLPARRPFDLLLGDGQGFFPARFEDFFKDAAGTLSEWEPAIDIKEEDKRYVITADIPGVAAADIDVRLENNVLSLSGERKTESRDEKNGYRRVERFEGSFFRAMTLPDAGSPDKVKAKAKDGVLVIEVPKDTSRQARRITVSS